MDIISSLNNPSIKLLRSLNEKKYRKFYGQFILEGPKSVGEAISAKTNIVKIFVSQSKYEEYSGLISLSGAELVVVGDKLFGKLTETVSPQGILAIAEMRASKEFNPKDKPFLVLDRISDPGNLGTILRTAVATGFNDLVLIDTVDPYNPKTVRSSASGINFVNFYPLDEESFLAKCKKNNIQIFVADMAGANIYKTKLPDDKFCLVIGNEGNGPSKAILDNADKVLSLPMKKEMESLNAAVCASIMLYTIAGNKL
ncbi:MAG: RNA methyltransferase [Clostridia bacterium]|nr:RNA methyltransferase [Clostridia bacterium]